jgi:hypothetical protein
MVKRKVAALEKTEADLAGLQFKMKKDPQSASSLGIAIDGL